MQLNVHSSVLHEKFYTILRYRIPMSLRLYYRKASLLLKQKHLFKKIAQKVALKSKPNFRTKLIKT
jgi:hypothetical protein